DYPPPLTISLTRLSAALRLPSLPTRRSSDLRPPCGLSPPSVRLSTGLSTHHAFFRVLRSIFAEDSRCHSPRRELPDGVCLGLQKIGRATSELQSLAYLVCRLLLEKKNNM